MNSILLAILLTAVTPPFEVQTLDGQTLVEADRGTVPIATDAADTHPVAPVAAASNGHGTRSGG